ncbi:MAG: hypothetical protein JO102_05755, partial [Elusimicrobia bacterium]|nr:hypothetical protein [Elusimicrobiota bacterium]
MTRSRPLPRAFVTHFSRRLLAAVLAFVVGTQPVLADLVQGSLWSERRASHTAPAALATPPLTRVDLLAASRGSDLPAFAAALPAAAGRVRRVLRPLVETGRPVLFIEDVHGSLEAQKNIAAAVSAAAAPGVTVALEGASGPVDLSRCGRFEPHAALQAAADYLFSQLDFSGPAYALLSGRATSCVAGVDDDALYRRNADAYRRAAPLVPAARASLEKRILDLNRRKAESFSADLAALDRAVEDFRAGRSSLGAYAAALAARVCPTETVARFLEAAGLESSLDFKKAEAERAAIVDRLVARASDDELRALSAAAVELRTGRRTPSAFYELLTSLCRRRGVSTASSTAFAAYVRYAALAESIDGDALWDDFRRMESAAFAAVASTNEQRRLVAESRRAYLDGRLIDFALTPPEWAEYNTSAARSDAALSAFEDFYRFADQRNDAMSANLEKLSGDLVLIAGGFHSAGLAERLRRSGRKVIVWSPALHAVDAAAGSKSLAYFSREATPLEVLFRGQKLFLAPPPFRGAPRLPPLVSAMVEPGAEQRAVDELWPEAHMRVDARRRGGRTHVEIAEAGTRVESEVESAGGRVTRFVEGAPAMAMSPIWGRWYGDAVRAARASRRAFWKPYAVVAAAGFIEDAIDYALLTAAAGVITWMLPAATASLGPFVLPILLGLYSVGFASKFYHPSGFFGGRPNPAPLSFWHRLGLFTVSASLAGLFLAFAPALVTAASAPSLVLAILMVGGVHALYNLVAYRIGLLLAISGQRLDPARLEAIVTARDERMAALRELSDEDVIKAATAFRRT